MVHRMFKSFLYIIAVGSVFLFLSAMYICCPNHVGNHKKAIIRNEQENDPSLFPSSRSNKNSILKNILNDSLDDGYFGLGTGVDCPYTEIRKKNYTNPLNRYCQRRIATKNECREAWEKYDIRKAPSKCKADNKLHCHSRQKWRENLHSQIQVSCNISACGSNPVYIATMDSEHGILEPKTKWRAFENRQSLEEQLPSIVIRSTRSGFNYCFLKCLPNGNGGPFLDSVFLFPPVIPRKSLKLSKLNKRFNINVLMLDSISREHFYRMMPASVGTMRRLVYESAINATVLDFELFQSLAPSTFPNLKAFFTGNTSRASTQTYNIDAFIKQVQAEGFRTLFQEDSCWFDSWGTVLTNGVLTNEARNKHELKSRWNRLKDHVKDCGIDDLGPTHASCVVFQKFKVTNQFNKPTSLCFGGKPLASYFLDYLESSLGQKVSSPLFAFTLLATGHEITGLRIKQADERLAQHIEAMARDQNTLTLMFSDHGPKTTLYSRQSRAGMYELHSPFMFAILPEGVANKLGEGRVRSLVANQHRLFTLADVHKGLVSILFSDDSKKPVNFEDKNEDIFGVIPESRSCSDIPMSIAALCVCRGREQWLQDNDVSLSWAAEFAVGEINNRISRSYRKSGLLGGFGKCQRLVMASFTNIRRWKNKKDYLVTMNVIVLPLNQAFEVVVKFPLEHRNIYKDKKIVKLLSTRRLTFFQGFLECKDEFVPANLCVCKRKGTRTHKDWKWAVMNSSASIKEIIQRTVKNFVKQPVLIVHLDPKKCLVLSIREHRDRATLLYEIGNVCTDRAYRVSIDGQSQANTLTSAALPMTLKLPPVTFWFAFTVYHLEKPHDFNAVVEFKHELITKISTRNGRGTDAERTRNGRVIPIAIL